MIMMLIMIIIMIIILSIMIIMIYRQDPEGGQAFIHANTRGGQLDNDHDNNVLIVIY